MAVCTSWGAALETHPTIRRADRDLTITIFLAAMSRPKAERVEFVREACADDVALLAEVERRVNWEERLGGFLLKPVLARERSDSPFAVGETLLGRYRIQGVAGEGGMAVVYEAFDKKVGRRIALKCPRLEFRNRLTPEAAKALCVTDANVCRVNEVQTAETDTGAVDFLTMEFLEGETLAARLAHAPRRWLETPQGKEIARQICAGLHAVHAAGVVHRDLKPGNVMLSTAAGGRPRAVIMDFGIAQGTDMFSSQLRGTPAYIAPELWKGHPATVQSDIYALGVLLFEMSCGRKPFPDGTGWKERLHAQPRAPDAREPLRSAISTCLDPEPKRRFQSVDEFEKALRFVSRRTILGGLIGLSATGLTAELLRERYWPSSAVRLAMLPASITGSDADSLPIINGFLQDLSYSLNTLRGARRPLRVLPPTETAPEGVTTAAAAKTMFGATHAMSSAFRRNASGWAIAVEMQTSTGRPLRRWNRNATSAGLAAQLFPLHSSIVEQTTEELALRAEHKPQTLPREVYADYLQGLYYARFDYENANRAIPFFERVIAAAPDSPLGHIGLAEALWGARYETGKISFKGKAFTELGKAEQLDPEMAQVYLIRGRLEADDSKHEEALADCKRASELAPNDSEAFIEMAISYYVTHRPHEAEAALQSAISAEPGYYKPYLDAGEFYSKLRDLASAERFWLKAVRLGPGQTRARLNLAKLYMDAGRLADAETQIVESLKIGRKQSTLETMAILQDRQGRYAQAIASYEEAILGPPSYTIWAGLGVAYRHARRESDAIRAFNNGLQNGLKGVRHYPREAEPLAWCAYYYAKLRETDPTRSFASQALAMAPSPEPDVRKLLVLAYDSIGDIEAARRLLDGAPGELLKELARGTELSPALRRDARFKRMTH